MKFCYVECTTRSAGIVLVLLPMLLFVGCPRTDKTTEAPSPIQKAVSPALTGVTSVEPLVIPLVPMKKPLSSEAGGEKQEAGSFPPPQPASPQPAPPVPVPLPATSAEPSPEGAALIAANSFAKIASEMILMAPVDDLTAQVDEYIAKIGGNIEDIDTTTKYRESADSIIRDANGLALIALSVGLAPADSRYKAAAPLIVQAALKLATATSLDEGKKRFQTLQGSLEGKGDATTLRWTKIAHLPPIMKAVPNLSATLTRLTNTERKLKRGLETNPGRIHAPSAALAAIFQGCIANADETTKPQAVEDWTRECEQFRDAALKANAATHGYADGKITYEQYWSTCQEMTEFCDHCHKIFYPNAVGVDSYSFQLGDRPQAIAWTKALRCHYISFKDATLALFNR